MCFAAVLRVARLCRRGRVFLSRNKRLMPGSGEPEAHMPKVRDCLGRAACRSRPASRRSTAGRPTKRATTCPLCPLCRGSDLRKRLARRSSCPPCPCPCRTCKNARQASLLSPLPGSRPYSVSHSPQRPRTSMTGRSGAKPAFFAASRTPTASASLSICLAWPQWSQIRKMQSCRQSGWSLAT